MLKYLVLISAIMFGCGRDNHNFRGPTGDQGPTGDVGPTGPKGDKGDTGVQGAPGKDAPVPVTPVVDTETLLLNEVVRDYNVNRDFAGQSQLVNGLTCTVYKFGTVASPQYPNSIAQATGGGGWTTRTLLTFSNKPVFNQLDSDVSTGMVVMPSQLRANPDYQTWYMLRCTGSLVVTHTDYYQFDLTTDDGGVLYIDGLTVNNDGNHGVSTKSGTITLNKGVHSFRLDYMQAAGNQALIIKANGELINPRYFYH